jgi:hypothetical protein
MRKLFLDNVLTHINNCPGQPEDLTMKKLECFNDEFIRVTKQDLLSESSVATLQPKSKVHTPEQVRG